MAYISQKWMVIMSEVQSSDAMKNLAIFIIELAVMGAILALAGYFLVDLPLQQAALQAPSNAILVGAL
jgi:hypothetical protein